MSGRYSGIARKFWVRRYRSDLGRARISLLCRRDKACLAAQMSERALPNDKRDNLPAGRLSRREIPLRNLNRGAGRRFLCSGRALDPVIGVPFSAELVEIVRVTFIPRADFPPTTSADKVDAMCHDRSPSSDLPPMTRKSHHSQLI
jgi:hypothetical protein